MRSPHTLPTVAVTMGDPAGVGPEVVLKALADPAVLPRARWLVICDLAVLEAVGAQIGVPPPVGDNVRLLDAGILQPSQVTVGRVSAGCGRAALEYIRRAVQLCLSGEAQAMATAPVNKEAVALGGEPFTGHTEFIAQLCGASGPRMMLAGERLRVVHVSTHIPLRQACDLDTAGILRTIELGHEAVRLAGFAEPRLAVCGLNPHAGEHGMFGVEDDEFVRPAVEAACSAGMRCTGPLPPDTAFLRAVRGEFDLVVAMYHDQGHIPMKLLDFEGGVNVTLGLPIIRTSVDHGTAFDIAGRNRANPRSMKAALSLAAEMAGRTARGDLTARGGR